MANLTYRVLQPGERFSFDPSHPNDPPGRYKGQEPLLQMWETGANGEIAGSVMSVCLRDFFKQSYKVNDTDGMQLGPVHLNSQQAKKLEDGLRLHHDRDYQIAVPKKNRLAIGEFAKRPPGLDSVFKPAIKSFLEALSNITSAGIHVPGPRL